MLLVGGLYLKHIQSICDLLVLWYAFEPPHDKTNKITCAPSEDSDQPRHPPSLITVLALRSMGN